MEFYRLRDCIALLLKGNYSLTNHTHLEHFPDVTTFNVLVVLFGLDEHSDLQVVTNIACVVFIAGEIFGRFVWLLT